MKSQIVLIHGGTTFETYEEYMEYLNSCEITLEKLNRKDWKDNLGEALPEFEVIYPKMPNAKNARYEEWKIWFEKLFPLLRDEVILVGHSLGGIFLTKYLSENDFPKKIKSVHLVVAPYDDVDCDESLADFALTESLEGLRKQAGEIYLYHSQDDTSVPYADVHKYKRNLPDATLVSFEDKGHFLQNDFHKLVGNIKS